MILKPEQSHMCVNVVVVVYFYFFIFPAVATSLYLYCLVGFTLNFGPAK